MKQTLLERHEDLINMLVRCRIKIDDREDPTVLDLMTDMRALPGIVTVRQTRPLSDPVTSSGRRVIELNVSYIPKYIQKGANVPDASTAMMQVIKMLKLVETIDMIKVVEHDNNVIGARLIRNPIIV